MNFEKLDRAKKTCQSRADYEELIRTAVEEEVEFGSLVYMIHRKRSYRCTLCGSVAKSQPNAKIHKKVKGDPQGIITLSLGENGIPRVGWSLAKKDNPLIRKRGDKFNKYVGIYDALKRSVAMFKESEGKCGQWQIYYWDSGDQSAVPQFFYTWAEAQNKLLCAKERCWISHGLRYLAKRKGISVNDLGRILTQGE